MSGSVHRWMSFLALAAIAVAVAGCGSSKKKAATSTTSGAYAPATATTTPTTTTPTAAKVYRLSATMTPGADVPKPKDATRAAGTFAATITLHGTTGTLSWVLTFSHLSGPATAAHVHVGPPGKAGPIAIPLCAPCKSPNKGSFTGPIGASIQLLDALLHGGAYVNVHTTLNPGGEIRGQISARPA